jgi:hypothetical protein
MRNTTTQSWLAGGAAAALLALFAMGTASAGPTIEFGDKGGFLQIDLKGQMYVENTDFGAGRTGQTSRTDIHFQRMRITATGMLDSTYGFKWQTCGNIGTTKSALGYSLAAQDVDWNDRDVRIIDAYGIANFRPEFNLKVGLTKIPLTRANLDDCFSPLSLDRSMFVYTPYGSSPAKFSRDVGMVAWGHVAQDRLAYFAGAFQGREASSSTPIPVSANPKLVGATAISSNAPLSNLEYVARLHVSLLDPEPGSGYEGTRFGDQRTLTIGGGVAYQSDAAYKNVINTFYYADGSTSTTPPNPAIQTPAVLKVVATPTDNQAVAYSAYAADLLFEYPMEQFGVFTFNAQYLNVGFEDAYKTNLSSGDRLAVIGGMNGQKKGHFLKAAYLLPVSIGGEGRFQPYGMYESWDFAHLLGYDNQKVTQSGGGLNCYVRRQNVRVTGEYLWTSFLTPTELINGPRNGAALAKVNGFATLRLMTQFVF